MLASFAFINKNFSSYLPNKMSEIFKEYTEFLRFDIHKKSTSPNKNLIIDSLESNNNIKKLGIKHIYHRELLSNFKSEFCASLFISSFFFKEFILSRFISKPIVLYFLLSLINTGRPT